MEFYGNRLSQDQVKTIVSEFMKIRYGNEEKEASPEEIRFALQHYLRQMTEEPNIYIHQNDHGEWTWDIIVEDLEDEAYYDHMN
ncbi:hypothetical protein [Ammoniphilus sp. YIM 78166]|uniref:hypothetical protein n=1 Tax=Ammoniphilus sp. YIM 78166 TaxID=1644106 RepID=UPI0014305D1D|nr:hypothetical protein [Ammoniphilus sp. YIM 78166]